MNYVNCNRITGLLILDYNEQLMIKDEFDEIQPMSVWDGSMRQLF